jgi:dethiobiotin synthetase
MNRYFVSGIGTDIGKTVVSAILTEALEADYWKPVQSGTEGGSDTERVASLVSNSKSVFHPESYCFATPVSPHQAAALENQKITISGFDIPLTENRLLIEGAGGLLVPLNNDLFVIDLAKEFEAEIILVCRNYLGCINHSLLSIDYLLRNDYAVKGIVLNGNFDKAVRKAICGYSEIPVLGEIPEFSTLTKESVSLLAQSINLELFA